MAFSAYSLTPASNLTIAGISIAENCLPANLNDAMRQFAADGKDHANTVAAINVSAYMPLVGGTFSAQIFRTGRGGYLHHANAAQIGGKVTAQTTGTALPASPAEGDFVYFY